MCIIYVISLPYFTTFFLILASSFNFPFSQCFLSFGIEKFWYECSIHSWPLLNILLETDSVEMYGYELWYLESSLTMWQFRITKQVSSSFRIYDLTDHSFLIKFSVSDMKLHPVEQDTMKPERIHYPDNVMPLLYCWAHLVCHVSIVSYMVQCYVKPFTYFFYKQMASMSRTAWYPSWIELSI